MVRLADSARLWQLSMLKVAVEYAIDASSACAMTYYAVFHKNGSRKLRGHLASIYSRSDRIESAGEYEHGLIEVGAIVAVELLARGRAVGPFQALGQNVSRVVTEVASRILVHSK